MPERRDSDSDGIDSLKSIRQSGTGLVDIDKKKIYFELAQMKFAPGTVQGVREVYRENLFPAVGEEPLAAHRRALKPTEIEKIEEAKTYDPRDAIERAQNIGRFLNRREQNFQMYYQREIDRHNPVNRREQRDGDSTDSL